MIMIGNLPVDKSMFFEESAARSYKVHASDEEGTEDLTTRGPKSPFPCSMSERPSNQIQAQIPNPLDFEQCAAVGSVQLLCAAFFVLQISIVSIQLLRRRDQARGYRPPKGAGPRNYQDVLTLSHLHKISGTWEGFRRCVMDLN